MGGLGQTKGASAVSRSERAPRGHPLPPRGASLPPSRKQRTSLLPYYTEGAVADGSVWRHLLAVGGRGRGRLSMVRLLLLAARAARAPSTWLWGRLLLAAGATVPVVGLMGVDGAHGRATLRRSAAPRV